MSKSRSDGGVKYIRSDISERLENMACLSNVNY